MTTTRVRSLLCCAALGGVLLAGPARSDAQDAQGPPTVDQVQLHETGGRWDDAVAGWARRYLGVKTPAERAQALQRYVAAASKQAAPPDAWLDDLMQRWGKGSAAVCGRRVVVVAPEAAFGTADKKLLGALFDVAHLCAERITGVRPPVNPPINKDDKRPRDGNGRLLIGCWALPKPLSEQAFDGWIAVPADDAKGAAVALQVAAECAQQSIAAAANTRARYDAAIRWAVRDLIGREIPDAAVAAAAEKFRAEAKKRCEEEWSCACLPGESLVTEEAFAHLVLQGLDVERASRDPAEPVRAYLAERRTDSPWGRGHVASTRDLALEPLTKSFSSGFCDVLRRAGVLPVGAAAEAMKARLAAEEIAVQAARLQGEGQKGDALRCWCDAQQALGTEIGADEMYVRALACDDEKKARVAMKKLGVLEGFEFMGPLPQAGWADRDRDRVAPALRIMPLAAATADGRRPLKMKEPPDCVVSGKQPAEISLKWEDVKEDHVTEDLFDRIVPHTPWGDRRGISWGGASVAAVKLTKDLGRWVRVRPMRKNGDPVVLADGLPCARFPDGSVIVPGAKGAEIVLAGSSQISCCLTWRDGRSVEAELAAAAAEPDPVLALRPWAARRLDVALPTVVNVLVRLPDASLVRDMVLLAPYRGGDAAACDAMLEHAKGRPAILAAYLDVCRGSRDWAVIDKIVPLGAAADATPDVLARVQAVVEGALFRKVTEKGADLAALWDRGRKWTATVATAEFEDVRELHESYDTFAVVGDPQAWGRACLAPRGGPNVHGEGYLALDMPDCPASAFLAVRWKPVGEGRLVLKGTATDGKKMRPFSIDVPAPASAKDWTIDVVEFGPVFKGRMVLAIDDPCASGCRIDAIAVGAKPLD